MKTFFEFTSTAFPDDAASEDTVQEQVYGRRLAEFVATKLRAAGYNVADVYAEDWGWVVELVNAEFPLWVGCIGFSADPTSFMCFIEPSRAFVQRWFQKLPTAGIVEPLADTLEGILRAKATEFVRREP